MARIPLDSGLIFPFAGSVLVCGREKLLRNGSGQAHFTAKMPVRKEGGTSARLSILYSVPVVKRMNTISHSLNRTI
jgi:hypothetical protein